MQGERGKGARPVWEGSTRLRRPLKLPAPWRFAGDTACVVTHAPSQRTVAMNGQNRLVQNPSKERSVVTR